MPCIWRMLCVYEHIYTLEYLWKKIQVVLTPFICEYSYLIFFSLGKVFLCRPGCPRTSRDFTCLCLPSATINDLLDNFKPLPPKKTDLLGLSISALFLDPSKVLFYLFCIYSPRLLHISWSLFWGGVSCNLGWLQTYYPGRMALNSWSSCLCLPDAEIAGISHCTWLLVLPFKSWNTL